MFITCISLIILNFLYNCIIRERKIKVIFLSIFFFISFYNKADIFSIFLRKDPHIKMTQYFSIARFFCLTTTFSFLECSRDDTMVSKGENNLQWYLCWLFSLTYLCFHMEIKDGDKQVRWKCFSSLHVLSCLKGIWEVLTFIQHFQTP